MISEPFTLSAHLEEEVRRPAVTAGHFLEQDGVDSQTGRRVGRLTQKTCWQTDKHTKKPTMKQGDETWVKMIKIRMGRSAGTRCRCLPRPRFSGWRTRRGSWFYTLEPSSPDHSAASCSSPGPTAARRLSRPSCRNSTGTFIKAEALLRKHETKNFLAQSKTQQNLGAQTCYHISDISDVWTDLNRNL